MQTFLPYSDFYLSLTCLDYRRLGNQRVEARQILNTLEGKSSGWQNHPAVVMWAGYEPLLSDYLALAIREWIRRGYRNTMEIPRLNKGTVRRPRWLGNEVFHASHRSNLLRKAPDHYSAFGWTEGPDLPYVWPGRT